MKQVYFIFILSILLVFFIINASFEKKHDDESILQEKKVKKSLEDISFVDDLYRILTSSIFLS